MVLGGIEAGGTKMVCAIGDEKGNIIERVSFPTTTREETISKMIDYFKDKQIEALGIGCFGPLDLNKNSETYGYITTTPKQGWEFTDMITPFQNALKVPVQIDTDVNAAVYGEVKAGCCIHLDTAIYMTVGTGIGIGAYVNGTLLHGLLHPEGGHIYVKTHPLDSFQGCCPYHKNCLEGLASGTAIFQRWHKRAEALYDDEKVWDLEAYYLGQAISNYIVCLAPEKIVVGGGLMHKDGLIEKVREEIKKNLGGYIQKEQIQHIETYIVSPALKDNAGIVGSILLGIKK